MLFCLLFSFAAHAQGSSVYFVKGDQSISVTTEDGIKAWLPAGAKVTLTVLNLEGHPYDPASKIPPMMPAAGNPLTTHFDYVNGNSHLSGRILTSQVTPVSYPAPLHEITPKTTDVPKEVLLESQPTSISAMVRLFHDTNCNLVSGTLTRRQSLLDQWSQFIERQPTADSRHLAELARATDLVARTVLFEAHAPGTFPAQGDFDRASQCEYDIITLSLSNRARICRKLSGRGIYFYGCTKGEEDFAAVATAPSQYNIWFSQYLASTRITGCFLRQDLLKILAAHDGKVSPTGVPRFTDPNFTSSQQQTFFMFQRAFAKIVDRVPVIIGLYQSEAERLNGRYLNEFFKIKQIGTISNNDDRPDLLLTMTNYYHPQAMPSCSVDHYPKTKFLNFGYIQSVDHSQKPRRFYEILVGKNLLPIGSTEEGTKIEVETASKGAVSYNLPDIPYSETALVSDFFALNPNISQSCLPKAYLPVCDRNGDIYSHESMGKKVPLTWMSKEMKIAFADKIKKYRGIEMSPEWWHNPRSSKGQQIGLACLEETGYSESIGGACDTRMMPMSGVDSSYLPGLGPQADENYVFEDFRDL
jgi:hypothetical protein